jgi:hypothetical protein
MHVDQLASSYRRFTDPKVAPLGNRNVFVQAETWYLAHPLICLVFTLLVSEKG